MLNSLKIVSVLLVLATAVVATYYLLNPISATRADALHYASAYDADVDEMGRCASADLAAMYFRRDGDSENFEQWKAKAHQHCPAGFPYAYHQARNQNDEAK